ncbi:hypothetical protein EQG41_15700 [Billgrantia azerbaijanica]|nr:hypothetical protein EQG41_15700 [Halomonas azerbaijanica]
MDDATLLRITQWRKRLERAGWTGIRRASPPRGRLIEYHLVWRDHLVSGRVRLADQDHESWWQPGSPTYLFMRGVDVTDGVWRVARNQSARAGQVHRRLPA